MTVGRPVAANPIAQQPREHQREAISDAVAALDDHARALIVMACGTGKTLVAQRVSEQVNAHITMVLAPTLALLEQLAAAWREHTTRDLRYIVVCPDEGLDRDDLDVAHLDAETRSSVVTSPGRSRRSSRTRRRRGWSCRRTTRRGWCAALRWGTTQQHSISSSSTKRTAPPGALTACCCARSPSTICAAS